MSATVIWPTRATGDQSLTSMCRMRGPAVGSLSVVASQAAATTARQEARELHEEL